MNAREILEQAVREDVSDIFIVAGLPVSCRKNGNIIQTQEEKLFPKETEALLNEIYGMAGDRDMMNLLVHGDDDFSFAIPGVSRFRVSAYKQRGALSAVIRVITFQLAFHGHTLLSNGFIAAAYLDYITLSVIVEISDFYP